MKANPILSKTIDALIDELNEIVSNPIVEAAYNDAIANVHPVLWDDTLNPWTGTTVDYFVDYFRTWFDYLPTPDGGLGEIVPFTYLYYNNVAAFYFLNQLKSRKNNRTPYSLEIFNWTVKFIKARGEFMDSKDSLQLIDEWLKDPSTHMDQFIVPEGGYKSFNEFFTRKLKMSVDPRPISHPDDDSVLTASADSELNFIESELTMDTTMNIKGRQISMNNLLDKSKFAEHFVGGNAISCVLMPNDYHRYHSPINGEIVESQEVPGIYNGIMDGEDWFNSFNVGESTTDFSIFEDFHRAYFIFKTLNYGYVAMVPVGLNTISAIYPSLVNEQSSMVPPGAPPVKVKKGDELGHFAYGGSLNILIFQKGVFSSISVLMGQRIGSLSPLTNS